MSGDSGHGPQGPTYNRIERRNICEVPTIGTVGQPRMQLIKNVKPGKVLDILYDLLRKSPEEIFLNFSDYQPLLQSIVEFDYLSSHVNLMVLLMQLLSQLITAQASRESLLNLLSMVFQRRFIDGTVAFLFTAKKCSEIRYFHYLQEVVEFYINAFTYSAADQLQNLVDCGYDILKGSSMEGITEELIMKWEGMQKMLAESCKQWKKNVEEKQQRKFDNSTLDPPEDYRQLSVLPTSDDLCGMEHPFIRKNIIKGKYQDAQHYLDVQFRLLREDFVQPLRYGINNFQKGQHSRDIRVYRGVSIENAVMNGDNLYYMVHLNLPEKVSMENSKRLMHGNLVCFSADGFRTILLGSVVERKPELLQRGVVGVKFDTELPALGMSKQYIMVESKAFFVAYKHVLLALQNMNSEDLPLQKYIICVSNNIDYPSYITEKTVYHILTNSDDKKLNHSTKHMLVKVQSDISEWPTAEMLSLDESQHRALHGALTHEMAIIQGPPGTGKTFIGLKIVEILLNNKLVWNNLQAVQDLQPVGDHLQQHAGADMNDEKKKLIEARRELQLTRSRIKAPIVLVCYTNHALDQFLEGVINYTKDVVRVGSRTKSVLIEGFQIQNKVMILDNCNQGNFWELKYEVSDIENALNMFQQLIKECHDPQGIFSERMERYHIIPPNILQQLLFQARDYPEGKFVGLMSWLLDERFRPDFVYNWANILQENKTAVVSNTSTEDNVMMIDAYVGVNEIGDTANTVMNGEGNLTEEELKKLKESEDQLCRLKDNEVLISQEENERMLDSDEKLKLSYECEKQVRKFPYEISLKSAADQLLRAQSVYENSLILGNASDKSKWEMFSYTAQYNAIIAGMQITRVAVPNRLKIWEKDPHLNIWMLDFKDRWHIYTLWLQRLSSVAKKRLKELGDEYVHFSKVLQKARLQQYLEVMRQSSVVGMTTTGAAQYMEILQDLGAPIVIVEEAAEILEAHVITALSSKCKHLILIGDHQQLRPSATVHELATKFGLEVSLFERMIKNGVAYETLDCQHRMRPSISRLLVPNIYPHLKDHESVHEYPHVRGMAKDVFFITHSHHEAEMDDNNSHENKHEAEFILALCRHLILQGYSPSQITVLTPYSGQYFLLKKLARESYTGLVEFSSKHCGEVHMTMVDNFQGEENYIILLSLVRSNEKGIVGFLKTDNRVCVALSRAKQGLYVIGNMDQLKAQSKLWHKISEDLVADDSLGSSMTLRCQNHPDQLTHVETGTEFLSKSPHGGCLRQCSSMLAKCGHPCQSICHTDNPDHTNVKCMFPCPKKLCALEHPCPLKCFDRCKKCQVIVDKTFPCGHSHEVPCYVDETVEPCKTVVNKYSPCGHSHDVSCFQDMTKFYCNVLVDKILPLCQHVVTMKCCISADICDCNYDCDTRLDCGHKCPLQCHRRNDPDHEHFQCEADCTKPNKLCSQNHMCEKRCYEECGVCIKPVQKTGSCGHVKTVKCHVPEMEIKCPKKCEKILACSHPCPKLCCEECGNCLIKVEKIVPFCGHKIEVACDERPTAVKCPGQCPLKLACGHPCTKRCMDPCTSDCMVQMAAKFKCPQNHYFLLPCYAFRTLSSEKCWCFCKEPCNQILSCGHTCQGNCADCYHGRIHVPCQRKCEKFLMCGHRCKDVCGYECGKCNEKCPRKCPHHANNCSGSCAWPCAPCKKNCTWNCAHQQCTEKCGNKCSRKPCMVPCDKMLSCKHPCIGFCGDRCPPLCRVCDEEQLKAGAFGSPVGDPRTRFIFLENCKHVIEAECLRDWLNQNEKEVGMKLCPLCWSPIENLRRFQCVLMEARMKVNSANATFLSSMAENNKLQSIIQDAKESCLFDLTFLKNGLNSTGASSAEEASLLFFKLNVMKVASDMLVSLGIGKKQQSKFGAEDKTDMLVSLGTGKKQQSKFGAEDETDMLVSLGTGKKQQSKFGAEDETDMLVSLGTGKKQQSKFGAEDETDMLVSLGTGKKQQSKFGAEDETDMLVSLGTGKKQQSKFGAEDKTDMLVSLGTGKKQQSKFGAEDKTDKSDQSDDDKSIISNQVSSEEEKYGLIMKPLLQKFVSHVMSFSKMPSVLNDITGELQRLQILPYIWKLQDLQFKTKSNSCAEKLIVIEKLLKSMQPFNTNLVPISQILQLMVQCEKLVPDFHAPKLPELKLHKCLSLSQGNWLLCIKGHTYTRAEGSCSNLQCRSTEGSAINPGNTMNSQPHNSAAMAQHNSVGLDHGPTSRGSDWRHTSCGSDWHHTSCGSDWHHTSRGSDWRRTSRGSDWRRTSHETDHGHHHGVTRGNHYGLGRGYYRVSQIQHNFY